MRDEKIERLNSLQISKRSANYLVYIYLFRDLKYAINKYAKGKVLDIGCGNKPYKSLFNTESYIGCDVVQSSNQLVDVICEATNIPLESNTFETIFSTQTIEHVFEHDKMIAESYRLLKNDGIIILSGPMYWPHHEVPYDFFRFTKYGLEEVLKKNGFSVLEILPNGGKWALWGLVTLQVFPKSISSLKAIKWIINTLCFALDKKYPDFSTTSNFVIIAIKK